MSRNPACRLACVLIVCLMLASCGIESAAPGPSPLARPSVTPGNRSSTSTAVPATVTASGRPNTAAEGQYFVIDKLVRSSQLEGIDLHVRYVEREPGGLTVHLSFYNNRNEDLAYVSGADVDLARLVGQAQYAVSAHSPSLDTGIDPDGGWLSGGATVGTLTFAGAEGDTFSFEFPGFPAVELSLDQPVSTAPDPAPPATGEYRFNVEVQSAQLDNITLRVEQARIEADALLLTVSFVNNNNSDITFTSTVTGADAVIFDALWQQYRPGQVSDTLATGIEPPGDVWGEDEANTGVLAFPRPTAGDVLLFHFPTYPLVRLPLSEDTAAGAATGADLPPSVAPRPTPTPAPTPTPLTGDALLRKQAADLVAELDVALAQNDRDAYLAGFLPELHEVQGAIFDRIATLPIVDVSLEPGDDEPNGIVDGDGTITGYAVELRYSVRDVNTQFSSTLELTLQQLDGRWLVGEVGGQRPFWAYGPSEAIRSGAFWIFYRPEMADELPAIEAEAQAAWERVNRALPERAEPVNVMYVTAARDEFEYLTERSGDQFLGVAAARYQIKKRGIEITSQAFFINGAAFRSDPAQDRQRTIAHELTHLVLSPQTMPYTPAWVSEGAAMYVTDDLPSATIARWYREQGPESIDLAELTGNTSFGEFDGTGEQTSINYAYAAFLVRYLVETYGEEQFFRFYESFADVPFEEISDELPRSGGGSVFDASMETIAQQVTPAKLEAAYDINLQTLEQDYERWLQGQIGD